MISHQIAVQKHIDRSNSRSFDLRRGSVRKSRRDGLPFSLTAESVQHIASLGSSEQSFLDGLRDSIENKLKKNVRVSATGGTGSSGEDNFLFADESDSEDSSSDDEHSGSSDSNSSRTTTSSELAARIPWYIIIPTSPWKVRWDIFTGIFVIYTVLVLTWRIGFDQDSSGAIQVFDYIVDSFFAVDTVVCFFTGYYNSQDLFVFDSWMIAKRYLRTMFLPDVLSWIPLDLIAEAMLGKGRSLSSVKLARFIRLVRLTKLMRLFKLQRFMKFLEETLDLKPSVIRTIKLLFNILFLAHLLSCCWHFLAIPVCGDDQPDAPSIGPCSNTTIPTRKTWVRSVGVDRFGLFSRYVASFYFITTTMMGVGYGDIRAENTEERVFCIVLQLIGSVSFGFILSSVTVLFESANPRDQELTRRINEVKEWLAGRSLPRHIRTQIREHFQYALSKKSIFNEAEILGNMPCSIRVDVIKQSYGQWLRRAVVAFPGEDQLFFYELVQHMQPLQVFYEEDVLEAGEISNQVYIVLQGCLEGLIEDGPTSNVPASFWVSVCLRDPESINSVTHFLAQNRTCTGTLKIEESSKMDDPEVDSLASEDTSSSEDEVVSSSVLCAFFGLGEMVGHVNALPMEVRSSSSRTELLMLQKEMLLQVFAAYPGAINRHEVRIAKLQGEIEKVLASRTVSSGERSMKALLLMNSVAKINEELPDVYRQKSEQPRRKSLLDQSRQLLSLLIPTDEVAGDGGTQSWSFGLSPSIGGPNSPKTPTTPSSRKLIQSATFATTSFSTSSGRRGQQVHRTLRIKDTEPGSRVEYEESYEEEEAILKRWVIPPMQKYKFWWDFMIGVLITYSALVIPWRVGFAQEQQLWGLVWDSIVDAFFFMDMVLSFNTAFVDAEGTMVTVRRVIQQNYLRTWFVIDFFATVPIDQLIEGIVQDAEAHQTGALKLIRIVRLIRILKLTRMLKMGKILQSIENSLDLSPLAWKCINLGARLTIISHFIGCFWYFISLHNYGDNECSTGRLRCNDQLPQTTWWKVIGIADDDDDAGSYVAALYYAFTTLATVGYGDITAQNNGERVYTIFAMILGSTLFGSIIGSIAALSAQGQGTEALTKKHISLVRDFCDEQGISKNKVREVVKHYQFFYQERSPFNEQHYLSELPPRIRKQAILSINRDPISRIGLFAGPSMSGLPSGPLPDWFVCWTMRLLEPQAVLPGEIIINADDSTVVNEICFIIEGECEAFQTRTQKPQQGTEGSADTGGSVDCDDERQEQERKLNSSSGKRDRTLMVYLPGCVFGLEHVADALHGAIALRRYSVRCSRNCPTMLYTLTHSNLAEVAATSPEMHKVLIKACTNTMLLQSSQSVPHKNMELRRLQTGTPGTSQTADRNSWTIGSQMS